MTSDSEDDNGEPVNKGAYRKGRRTFTIQEKAAIIRTVERLMQQHDGVTRREACEDLNITSGMHWAWKQKIVAMLETKKKQHQGKMHLSWKGFLFDCTQARIIAIYLRTP